LSVRWLGLEIKVNGEQLYEYGIHGTNDEKSIATIEF
jgi:hypothetical protein